MREGEWTAPLYWEGEATDRSVLTLGGRRALSPSAPVCHVSLYEASAFARWAGARLASEEEWEVVANEVPVEGNLLERGLLQPAPTSGNGSRPAQMFGDVWEWTRSAYAPYPGFRPPDAPIGEYNAKFMSGQGVLQGGSCVTPATHVRASYRNFFQPDARWQFSGIRLARDAG